ncbi:ABC transporter substrate-binding protein [Bifidobacterium scardovii]|uniref:Solute-binding protein of ABC transporter system n=1 Tax=Bifidobacterium scardovii TaxID=158787 RepID=A0A087DG65_9BIFI|nr:sugar ABC transporter substrate-binding protein [Bifidobacterium scardovii]KFI94515.1 solute-binding protein of ABC transporter system [Bifidobacterium scardovii]MDK6349270.1 sugar ABC transporter substrate-binding protein [Bifidobacterium scardovii]MDU8980607.1 sugar ABC transporter substrate-binding protein [Bifidobacterium scardovii]BAQ31859.1 putative sugar ABC transporter substrate binding component [Bifidobacterium scardovii JCM 12489 = DSM 13734]
MRKGYLFKAVGAASALAMITGLAACGSDTASTDNGGKVEISFQTKNLKGGYEDYFTKLIAEFEKENPNITVKWIDQPGEGYVDKLSTDAAAGELPDVFDLMPGDAYPFAKAGAIENISKSDPDAEKNYTEGSWAGLTFSGFGIDEGAYGYPWYLTAGSMFYNKSVLEECGVDSSKIPTNWEEYFSMADQFAKTCGNTGKYWDASVPTIGDFAVYGVDQMNKDQTKFTINSDKGVEFVQHYVDMYKEGVFSKEAAASNGTQSTDQFKQGMVAARRGFMYDLKDMQENAPDLYKNIAVGPGLGGETLGSSMEMLSVSATSKHKEEAMKLAAFVTNNKNQVDFAKSSQTFPSSAEGYDDDYFQNVDESTLEGQVIKMVASRLKTAKVTDPAQFTSQDSTELLEQLGAAITGQITAKEALDSVVESANARLNQ